MKPRIYPVIVCVWAIVFVLQPHAEAAFGIFGKNKPAKPVVEDKLSDEDKIGFVNRGEKDLTKLKKVEILVTDAIDANCAFKIKSVLQDNDAIYKVVAKDFKNYTVYFDEGQAVNLDLITTIVTAAGYQPKILP